MSADVVLNLSLNSFYFFLEMDPDPTNDNISLWGDVFTACLLKYYCGFWHLEDQGYLDINNALHLYVLHLVFTKQINQRVWNYFALVGIIIQFVLLETDLLTDFGS